MLCRLLTQDVDFQPALFFDFPKQRLLRIFVQFNVAPQWKPLLELFMINQQDTVLVDHKRHNRKIHQLMNVGHGDSSYPIGHFPRDGAAGQGPVDASARSWLTHVIFLLGYRARHDHENARYPYPEALACLVEDHHRRHSVLLTVTATHDALHLEPHGAILLSG